MHCSVVSHRCFCLLLWSSLLLTGTSLGGCLIPERPTECQTDQDCQDQYGGTSQCAEDQICEPATCKEGDDVSCQQQFGPRARCKQRTCQIQSKEQYLAPPCDFGTVGPVFEEGTYNIGVIMAHSQESRAPLRAAVEFAQSDINNVSGIDGRSLGLIYCDTKGDNDTAREAAQHLADIGVQAVVGPDFSSYTVELVPDVLAPNEILTISPTATSEALSSIQDDNYFWRTAPSNAIQTPPLGQLVENLVTDVIPNDIQPDLSAEDVKVAMMTRDGDAYAEGIQQGVVSNLPDSISNRIEATTYPNAGEDEGNVYAPAAEDIAEHKPDIVMLWGLEEVWTVLKRLDAKIEEKIGETPETIYVMADGGKTPETVQEIIFPDDESARPSLKGRVWGTAPRARTNNYDPYDNFKIRFGQDTDYDASSSFITNAYDAVFLVGYAAAAADTFGGPQLVEEMDKLTDQNADEVVASQQDFPRGVDLLLDGNSIKFSGVSGPIDFDDNGDPKDWNISLWCLQNDSSGSNDFAINDVGLLHKIGSSDFQMQRCSATAQDS